MRIRFVALACLVVMACGADDSRDGEDAGEVVVQDVDDIMSVDVDDPLPPAPNLVEDPGFEAGGDVTSFTTRRWYRDPARRPQSPQRPQACGGPATVAQSVGPWRLRSP